MKSVVLVRMVHTHAHLHQPLQRLCHNYKEKMYIPPDTKHKYTYLQG